MISALGLYLDDLDLDDLDPDDLDPDDTYPNNLSVKPGEVKFDSLLEAKCLRRTSFLTPQIGLPRTGD